MTPEYVAAVVERQRMRAAADPIAAHRFSSPQARDFVLSVIQGIETGLRSGNVAAKTTEAVNLFTCLATGTRRIDGRTRNEELGIEEKWRVVEHPGPPRRVELVIDRRAIEPVAPWYIELPIIRQPSTWILVVESYKQAELSSIAAFKRWIGDRPAHYVKNSEGTSEIRIKYNGCRSDDHAKWSRFLVFPRGGTIPKGIRSNGALGDEPPDQDIWMEIRNRFMAGQPHYRGIAYTPLYIDQCGWLQEEFAQEASWRREIELAVFDNQYLPAWQKHEQLEKAQADTRTEAVLFGEFVNLSGQNPFKAYADVMREMKTHTRDPEDREYTVMAEPDAQNPQGLELMKLPVFEWWPAERDERYYVICDPSLGVDDPEHDPCGLLVVARRRPRVVARYNGFHGADPLGALAAILAEKYNDALVDVDMTGGYGTPTLSALKRYRSAKYRSGYPNINRSQQVDKGGKFRTVLGWTIDGDGKAEIIEAVRLELQKAKAGLMHCYIPSIGVVKCLQEAVMDKNGKLLKPRGVHYEDLICLGRALALLNSRPKAQARSEPSEHGRRKPLLPQAVANWR